MCYLPKCEPIHLSTRKHSDFGNHGDSYEWQLCECYSLWCTYPLHLIHQASAVSPASTRRFLILLLIFPLSLLTLSLLRGAEQMGMHKAVKPQFGGGMRRFSCDEDNIYENIESELCFFTSQVRSENSWPCEPHVKVVGTTLMCYQSVTPPTTADV